MAASETVALSEPAHLRAASAAAACASFAAVYTPHTASMCQDTMLRYVAATAYLPRASVFDVLYDVTCKCCAFRAADTQEDICVSPTHCHMR